MLFCRPCRVSTAPSHTTPPEVRRGPIVLGVSMSMAAVATYVVINRRLAKLQRDIDEFDERSRQQLQACDERLEASWQRALKLMEDREEYLGREGKKD
jgi:hypothetical protein